MTVNFLELLQFLAQFCHSVCNRVCTQLNRTLLVNMVQLTAHIVYLSEVLHLLVLFDNLLLLVVPLIEDGLLALAGGLREVAIEEFRHY